MFTYVGGRWVVDDYYEDKVLAEITEKGLKSGDFVGDLSEGGQPVAAAADSSARDIQSDRLPGSGPPTSMYRAGGATTLFGASGWGPFSDGPLNAVRKSQLKQDGATEENWIALAAARTAEMSAQWGKLRRQNLKICGGIQQQEVSNNEQRDVEMEVNVDGLDEGGARKRGAEGEEVSSRKKKRFDDGPLPLGIYEPHSGVVVCKSFQGIPTVRVPVH